MTVCFFSFSFSLFLFVSFSEGRIFPHCSGFFRAFANTRSLIDFDWQSEYTYLTLGAVVPARKCQRIFKLLAGEIPLSDWQNESQWE